MAAGSILRLSGGPDIMGKDCCSQTLKALAAYRSRRSCSSRPRLASVAGNGRLVGLGDGCALFGHEQVLGNVGTVSHPDWLTLGVRVGSTIGGGVQVCRVD